MSFEHAVAEWVEMLGSDGVVLNAVELSAVERATYATEQRVPVVLRPSSNEQVQGCMKVAGKWGVPVYPMSGGRNWGYGSRVPVVSGCGMMDLSRMKGILDFDEKLGCVTLEPGVTQRELYEFLQKQGSRRWMDATGSTAESSVVGNVVERGFGHTPYGDRFSNVCDLEVVMADGQLLRTGFSRLEKAQNKGVFRWGLGPYLDGLFTQSNLGVVTRLTLWLLPAPEYFSGYFLVFRNTEICPGWWMR
jgi:4-cresol dehydrogenase (hydroxylating) flavoprotein subunit